MKKVKLIKKKTKFISVLSVFLVLLLVVWIVGLFILYQNVINDAASNSQNNDDLKKKSDLSNPYEKWQPKIYEDNDKSCNSWRVCFKKSAKCPGKCRDSYTDFGKFSNVLPGQYHQYGDEENDDTTTQNWIPDVWMLRRMLLNGKDSNGNEWPPKLVTENDRELCEDIGVFGSRTDENKVPINSIPIRGLPLDDTKNKARILCMVYTMEEKHHSNIRAIRETWAGGCDGFLAFSTKSDPRIPSISLKHDGPESYNNMWQKVRSIWKFVGENYLNEFDFFFQGGEDLYVLPQNLRQYLSTACPNPTTTDFFAGRRFKSSVFFNSGGAGYALSQATLRKFVSVIDDPKCFYKTKTSMEDVMIARCLNDMLDIGLVDTRDSRGRERFHPFAPGSHYYWTPPKQGKVDWYEDYNRLWPPKLKEECCSPNSVSFHYIKKPAMVRHIHALLYYCD